MRIIHHLALALLVLAAAPAAAEPPATPSLTGAVAFFDAGQHEKAEAAFRGALGDRRTEAVARYYLGRIQLARGDADRAVVELERAVELRPKVSDFHFHLAQALLDQAEEASFPLKKLMKARSALRAFEEAVKLEPDHLDARSWLAKYLISVPAIAGGDRQAAFDQAREVAKRDVVMGHRITATLYWQVPDLAKAVEEYRALLRLRPDDVDAHFQLGKLYQRQSQHQLSLRHLARAVDLDPTHGWALFELGRTGAISGLDAERSLQALRMFLQREPGAPAKTRALAYFYMGQIRERELDARAAEHYRQALELDPKLEAAQRGLEALQMKRR